MLSLIANFSSDNPITITSGTPRKSSIAARIWNSMDTAKALIPPTATPRRTPRKCTVGDYKWPSTTSSRCSHYCYYARHAASPRLTPVGTRTMVASTRLTPVGTRTTAACTRLTPEGNIPIVGGTRRKDRRPWSLCNARDTAKPLPHL